MSHGSVRAGLDVLTPRSPGGVAVVEVAFDGSADDAASIVQAPPPVGGPPSLRRLPGGDRGLVVRPAPDRLLLMPHGGPAIVARLLAALRGKVASGRLGADRPPDPHDIAEAAFDAIARARSPRAIDLLLAQPRRWERFGPPQAEDVERSRRLDRLVTPPRVVLAGPPGIGKSTLLNALAGRAVAVTRTGPAGSTRGRTTRDPVATDVDLDGLVVQWTDTAGLGRAVDAIDAAAQARTRAWIAGADLLVVAGDAADPPTAAVAGRRGDLVLGLRADLGPCPGAEIAVSRTDPATLALLARRIRTLLVPDADLEADRPWAFPGSPRPEPRPDSPD